MVECEIVLPARCLFVFPLLLAVRILLKHIFLFYNIIRSPVAIA
jgi:hypothetical protein